jgi:hypothetical protein
MDSSFRIMPLEGEGGECITSAEDCVGMGIPFCNLYSLVFCLIVKVKKTVSLNRLFCRSEVKEG